MNWLDGLIVAIVILSTIIGLVRGLTREVISLISWVVALLVGYRFAPLVAPGFEKYIGMPELRLAIGFLLIFIGCLIVGAIVNYFVGKFVHGTFFSGLDRLLGIFFGATRGVAIVVVLLLVGSVTPLQHKALWKESSLLPKLDPLGLWIMNLVPENMLADHNVARAAQAM